jgi:hypothetical protein
MSFDNLPSDVLTYLAATPGPLIQEIVKVEWQRGTNTKYYSSTKVEALAGFTGLTGLGISSVDPRFQANQFLDIPLSAGLEDDSATLDFWDGDGAISTLFRASGEGTKVTVFYFLPAEDYLGEYFWGYLKAPKDSNRLRFKVDVAEGLRTPEIQIPRRIIQGGCQATFGGLVDPATSTPYFTTLAQVALNDCPYNVHISGGTVGNLSGGLPFTSCPRRSRSDCSARIGDDLSYLAFDVILEQTHYGKNNRFVAYTQANESALKQPLRLIYGYRFVDGLTLLGHFTQGGDGGYLFTISAIGEGEISNQWGWTLNGNSPTGYEHVIPRNGARRQNSTGFTPNGLNYSGTALVKFNYPVGRTSYNSDQIHLAAYVEGLKVRVYSDVSTYASQYSRNRAWCLLDILTNRRYGLGYAHSRMNIQDWIDLADWSEEDLTSVNESGDTVTTSTAIPTDAESGNRIYATYPDLPDPSDPPDTDPDLPEPTYVDATRTRFDAILDGRDARQAIRDICMAGRYGVPFHYDGKMRILPLKKELDLGEDAIPVFTDQGTTGRNILFENGQSTLSWSQKSDSELVNQVKVTFDNEAYQWAEQTIIYNDVPAQLAAGRAVGDDSQRVVEKAFALLGTTRFHEAIRSAKILLDLGEFDSGGLENNLSVRFKTWFPLAQALRLHKYRVIKVVNTFVNAFTERTAAEPFYFFRVMKLRRMANLQVEITAQAYPSEYYDTIENGLVINTGVTAPNGPIQIGGARPPRPIQQRVTLVSRSSDHIVVKVGG